jgi:hypothetical protein
MPKWEIRITRKSVQNNGSRTRTVGSYQVFHDDVPATSIRIGEFDVPLFGTTAEARGPSSNAPSAKEKQRIAAGRYPLRTTDGPDYMTYRYRDSNEVGEPMPGIELAETGSRSDILIHPGKNAFLSSVGCVNLCKSLPNAAERIDFPGSRRRVIALIEDMKRLLGANFPDRNGRAIPNAFALIRDQIGAAAPASGEEVNSDGTIDGNVVARRHGVAVRDSGVRIGKLHPKMGPVIAAVAEAARTLGLPQPVITSGNDSAHSAGSLHFKGRALDFRGKNITDAQGRALEAAVRSIIGGAYDVIFEIKPNPASDHLHVEYDP